MKINRGGVVPLFAIVLSENPYELYPSAFKMAREYLDSPPALRNKIQNISRRSLGIRGETLPGSRVEEWRNANTRI